MQGTGSKGQSTKSLGLRGRGKFANGEETIAATPVEAPPTDVEAASGVEPAEVRHVAVAVDLRDGTEGDNRVLPLLFRVFLPEGQQVLDLARLEARCLDRLDGHSRRHGGVEVEDPGLELLDAVDDHQEFLRGDVVALPVVVAGGDHLVERAAIVNRKRELFRRDRAELEGLADAVAVETGGRIEQIR